MNKKLILTILMSSLCLLPSTGCCKHHEDDRKNQELTDKSQKRRREERHSGKARKQMNIRQTPEYPGWIFKGYNGHGGKILVRDPDWDRDGNPRKKGE